MRRFLAIDNDLTGSTLEKMLSLDSMTQQLGGDVFLHGDGGSRVEIDFSLLREEWLEKGPLAIQRAKLTIPVSQTNAPFSDTIVRSLLCFMMRGDELQLLPDTELSAEVSGGYYNRQQKCYTLNVTRFVQELLSTPKPVTKLIIIADTDHIGVNRLILHNAKASGDKKLSLDITYTTL